VQLSPSRHFRVLVLILSSAVHLECTVFTVAFVEQSHKAKALCVCFFCYELVHKCLKFWGLFMLSVRQHVRSYLMYLEAVCIRSRRRCRTVVGAHRTFAQRSVLADVFSVTEQRIFLKRTFLGCTNTQHNVTRVVCCAYTIHNQGL
jgi:hypothetical protein